MTKKSNIIKIKSKVYPKTFSKKILINYQEIQTRVIILTNNKITDIFIENKNDNNIFSNIYLGIIKNILPSLEAIFIDIGLEKSAYLSFKEIKNFDISKYKKGDKILIQIEKNPISTKGAKTTTNIRIPGKYIVFSPYESGINISKNIITKKNKIILKNLLKNLTKNIPGNFIIRTETENLLNLTEKEYKKILKQEIKYLTKTWDKIIFDFNKFKQNKTPKILYKEDFLQKIFREHFSFNTDEFIIDSEQKFQKLIKFTKKISPNLINKITLYNKKNLFKEYNIENIFKKIFNQKIYLKSGGYIIIQETESLCAIDVNSGNTKGDNLEDVSTKTNLEAVEEIAMQLRLRNIGGIIIIDFIDMHLEKNRKKVLEQMKEAMQFDKARIKLSKITEMGLLEMIRQRKTESLINYIAQECPVCHGIGKIVSYETILIKIKKELIELDNKLSQITIILNPYFKNFFTKTRINFLKKDIKNFINIQYNYKININNFNISIKNLETKK